MRKLNAKKWIERKQNKIKTELEKPKKQKQKNN